MPDHDAAKDTMERLIRFEVKLDNLTADVKELKDGVNARLIDHDQRIKTIERIVDATNPNQRVAQIDDLMLFKHDQERRQRDDADRKQKSDRKLLALVSLVTGLITVLVNMAEYVIRLRLL